MMNETKIQEVKHLLSTGQRASISTKTFEEIIELLEHKTQLSIKQSKELIRLRKELQGNEQKNRKLLKDNEELKVLTKHWRNTSITDSQDVERLSEENKELKKQLDKYLGQEEEEIRQLNNDNKLDEILSAISKANAQMEKESNYKQALDEIEEFCIVYSNNHDAYETVYKHILDIISKAKGAVMGRNKVNVRISPYLRDCLQNFANSQATIESMATYFKDPEYGEITESMYSWAETVCEKLCSELNIKGKADEEIIASEYYVSESENRLTEQGILFKPKDGE